MARDFMPASRVQLGITLGQDALPDAPGRAVFSVGTPSLYGTFPDGLEAEPTAAGSWLVAGVLRTGLELSLNSLRPSTKSS
mmetsp:Transcript_16788/g.37131  ORF Transcript_16788/g.37131 Transcript_16788/m.37131 type:complete len:81 (+) Transcript_16788:66-308(+)